MQWILQDFEDTNKLSAALDRLGFEYSWHKVVPFVGDLLPAPEIRDLNAVVLFGAYTLWRYAEAHGLKPGVFRITPFLDEASWHPYLLNGPDARVLALKDIPHSLADDGRDWFLRPVEDSKEEPGRVKSTDDILRLAQKVLALDEAEIPEGSLRHDTLLMPTPPAVILKEWRIWVVRDKVVTYSLYKDGSRVVYRHEIDEDALAFAQQMVSANPCYSDAYVMDICRTPDGLRLLETNCINAAGFYSADLIKLAMAISESVQ
ncbi:MAG: ATP-grasp domain-containing protein [Paracoccaceae bacterium]|nr:ATP-grasp domain-containing protein [Paracoccaceae bacterium]